MPIRFRCPGCRQVLSVASRKAGQKVTCPACGTSLKVPAADSAVSPDEPQPAEPVSDEPLESVEETATAPVEDAPADAAAETTPEAPADDRAEDPAVPDSIADAGDKPDDASEPELAPDRLAEEEDDDDDEVFALRGVETDFEDMDLTPMVDVTFLLLIFFMITASFTLQKAIVFPPPSPEEQGAAVEPKKLEDYQDTAIIVEIHEDNSISVDYEPVPPDRNLFELFKEKMNRDGKNEMVIDASPLAIHETVVRVVDAGNQAEMQRIRLGMRGGS